ncbi:IDEAL domain-containing protein [Halalkalibacter sp. APA_J-10(15)]|uniref:IDEAL domain-containing protein n=1 Tax=unclassified Halalkalibacter TaxID=2893063 RepID=UPI001FF5915C|nr:IDEAL domain-containing protein [Halalkalibacter sp. APA_J-10(15)]MCK0473501.1 IDEAL domain-containing protein [Halalkalibacter sp. APA_J-10(15)]
MDKQYALDKKVIKQLKLISSLQSRSQRTVHSLYAQAILEYSMYHYKKEQLEAAIDQALVERNEDSFQRFSKEYKELLAAHVEGKTISEDGFQVYLPFEE